MGGGEEGFGRLQLLSQLGLSIIGVLKGLFGSMTGSFFPQLKIDRQLIEQFSPWIVLLALQPIV
jgi:hypothetical protein